MRVNAADLVLIRGNSPFSLRTVKLWTTDSSRFSATARSSSTTSSSSALSSINSFEDFSDYVLDVAWSPVAPPLFASVDAGGVLALWDITSDLQQPFLSVRPDPAVALNRLAWSTSCLGGGKDQVRQINQRASLIG